MATKAARTYPGISPKAYEHPADRAATSALQSIPLLDRVLKRLSGIGLERRYRQMLLGNAVLLGPDQVPRVWELQTWAAQCLDVPVPPLYVAQTPLVNGMTIGSRQPVIIVSSSLVTGYPSGDLRVVLAHEMGHVLSEHYYYTSVLNLLATLANSTLPMAALAGLPLRALYMALLEWSRSAELSCDRAAAIATADPLAVCTALMHLAGGSVEGLDVNSFLRQANAYVDEDDLLARHARFGAELGQTHPFAVRRVRQLMDWVASGEYDRIVDGSYTHRGEEAPVSAEFESAVSHYRERFTASLDRTAGGLARVLNQAEAWLRNNPTDADEEAANEADDEPSTPVPPVKPKKRKRPTA